MVNMQLKVALLMSNIGLRCLSFVETEFGEKRKLLPDNLDEAKICPPDIRFAYFSGITPQNTRTMFPRR